MRICYKSFTGGEVAPSLTARYDLQKFPTFVGCMENMLPGLHGDVSRRPGTRFFADLGVPCVLIPFSFSVDPAQNFCLILSEGRLRVASQYGMEDADIETPYVWEDLYDISYAQVGDIVYLAHKNYPLHKIMRSGSYAAGYEWALEEVVLNTSIAAPAKPTVTFSGTAGSYTLRYKVVAVDADGMQSLPSEAGSVATGKHPSDWTQGNSATVTWAAVEGATEYNIYREEAGYYGFVGISTETTFVDNNYEADTADTPKEDWDPFADGNNPATVAFHQQRMVLGGTRTMPQAFYLSRTSDFENFRKSRPLQDDDPVEYVLASGSIDSIVWAASFGDLLIGTSGAEYKATGDGGVITTKNVNITSQSYWGSAGLAPLIIGNSILHVQRHGARVRDLYYSLEKDGYSGNDLSIMAPHLFDGHELLQWAYQQTPGSNVWAVRDDGVLLCMTYMKEHDVYGWSRHITNGKFLSVCTLSGRDADIVWLVVEREINGEKRYTLERMANQWTDRDTIEQAFFVDCGFTVEQEDASDTVHGLEYLEGVSVNVLADGGPVEGCVVQDGQITLPYPARTVHVGLPYVSTLGLLPLELDAQNGSTLGKRRAYGKCVVRFHRSVGGEYGANLEEMFDIPFLPDKWGEACQPFSGDIELILPTAQRPDTRVWIRQSRPMPMRMTAIAVDVDFGEV